MQIWICKEFWNYVKNIAIYLEYRLVILQEIFYVVTMLSYRLEIEGIFK